MNLPIDRPRLSFWRHWPLAVALLVFFALALPDLDLPGLHYDEALEAATPAALLLNGQHPSIVNNGVLTFGELRLPLMVQNHIGALQVYLAMPFVALLGPTTFALRLMTVLVGALTLIGLYLFLLRAYGGWSAAAGVLALAAMPSFVFWSRQGVFVTNIAPCCAVWALAAGARWWSLRRLWLMLLVGLLAGLAVYAKLSALWLLNGALAWGVLHWLLLRRHGRFHAANWRTIAAAICGFIIGILPILLYNVITGFQTLAVVENSANTTYLGTSNRDVVGNFVVRVQQLFDVMASGTHLWYLGGPFPNTLFPLAVGLAVLITIGALVARRGEHWQRTLFPLWLLVACLLQSCFTISALWYTHFAIVVWLPAVIIGVAAGQLEPFVQALARSRRLVVTGVSLVLIGVLCASQMQTSWQYLDALRYTGGFSFHSTAISDVSRYLDQQPEPVMALDWGFSAPIEYLTDGRKQVEELYGFTRATPPDFAATLQKRFGEPALYLTHAINEEAFPRRQAFLDAVKAAGLRAETVNISTRRDGLPVIEVWRVY